MVPRMDRSHRQVPRLIPDRPTFDPFQSVGGYPRCPLSVGSLQARPLGWASVYSQRSAPDRGTSLRWAARLNSCKAPISCLHVTSSPSNTQTPESLIDKAKPTHHTERLPYYINPRSPPPFQVRARGMLMLVAFSRTIRENSRLYGSKSTPKNTSVL